MASIESPDYEMILIAVNVNQFEYREVFYIQNINLGWTCKSNFELSGREILLPGLEILWKVSSPD